MTQAAARPIPASTTTPPPATSRPCRRHVAGAARSARETTNWTTMVILFLCALTVLLPLYVTVSMSLKTTEQAVDGNAFFSPSPIDFSGFAKAWELTNFPVAFTISILVTAGTVVGTVILASLASYAIVRNWEHRRSAGRSSTCSRRCSCRSRSSRSRRSS